MKELFELMEKAWDESTIERYWSFDMHGASARFVISLSYSWGTQKPNIKKTFWLDTKGVKAASRFITKKLNK